MYIYVYLSRAICFAGEYIVATLHHLHPPLVPPSRLHRTSRCCHAFTHFGLIHDTGATRSAYFFLSLSSPYIRSPLLAVLPSQEALSWRRARHSIKSCQGTVFSLSTVVKNRCKPRRGTRLKATLRSQFFARKT